MNAMTKLALTQHSSIPFNKLKLAPENVRRVKATMSIEDLAFSIALHGLVQGLSVRRELGADGVPTGFYLVQAGGRRFRALSLLVQQKRLNKTAPIPCILSEDGLAEETSLAENEHRLPLHPADQFRAFKAMADKGRSDADIAAAFFTDTKTVQQRLRLADVAQSLFDAYVNDEMTLAHLMAFSISNDKERQEQIWAALKHQGEYSRQPYRIRQLLMETNIPVSDKRMRFVGTDTYLAAGGTISRDLFEADEGGWADNLVLVERLVGEKLQSEADALKAQGWLWVEHAIAFPYNHTYGMRRIEGRSTISEADVAEITHIQDELETILAGYHEGEDLPDEVDVTVAGLEEQLEQLQNQDPSFTDDDKRVAGCLVFIDGDGDLAITKGWVRPEDEQKEEPGPHSVDDVAAPPAHEHQVEPCAIVPAAAPFKADDSDEDDGGDQLSDRLRAELTATRTLALRDAVGSNPAVALTALLHRLVCDEFNIGRGIECLDASVKPARLACTDPDLGESAAAISIEARRQGWRTMMPTDSVALWSWIESLPLDQRLALLAHCIGQGINAQFEKVSQYGYISPASIERRIEDSDRLATMVGLDLAESGWKPTAQNFLTRIPKRQILAAVREAKGERFVGMIDHLKKPEMVREAERLLSDTNWLPAPLRTPAPLDDGSAAAAETIPAFLTDPDGLVSEGSPDATEEPAPLGEDA